MNTKQLRELERLIGSPMEEQPPKNYFTRRQLQEKWNLSSCSASRKINNLLRRNLLVMKKFKVRSGQVVRPIPHYKIK